MDAYGYLTPASTIVMCAHDELSFSGRWGQVVTSCASRSDGVQHATPLVVVTQRLPRGTRSEAEVRFARLDAASKQIARAGDVPRGCRNRGLLGPAYVAGARARQYFLIERLGSF